MLGKLQQNQPELFRPRLTDLINPNHELARKGWQRFLHTELGT